MKNDKGYVIIFKDECVFLFYVILDYGWFNFNSIDFVLIFIY